MIKVRDEALRTSGKIFKSMPTLRTDFVIKWEGKKAAESLNALCVLLKGNAIPTKELNLIRYQKEKENERRLWKSGKLY